MIAKLLIAARIFARMISHPAIRRRNENFGHLENVIDLGFCRDTLPLQCIARHGSGIGMLMVGPQGEKHPQGNHKKRGQHLDFLLGRTITDKLGKQHHQLLDKPPSHWRQHANPFYLQPMSNVQGRMTLGVYQRQHSALHFDVVKSTAFPLSI